MSYFIDDYQSSNRIGTTCITGEEVAHGCILHRSSRLAAWLKNLRAVHGSLRGDVAITVAKEKSVR